MSNIGLRKEGALKKEDCRIKDKKQKWNSENREIINILSFKNLIIHLDRSEFVILNDVNTS